uniref:Uncharacterized protein n=1 Tax=Anguilla anguilla TaxID=7936 RepID=A0A0E9ST14_ANGAN
MIFLSLGVMIESYYYVTNNHIPDTVTSKERKNKERERM